VYIFQCPYERCATEWCVTEQCATERCATERCATERCASERCTTERCATEWCPIEPWEKYHVQLQRVHLHCVQLYHVQLKAIPLNHPHSWLYSIAADQQITIECDGRHEQRMTIKNTSKIELKDKCKLTTRNMTIQSKEVTIKVIFETDMETYLPELNITLLRDQKTMSSDNNTLQSLSQHRAKLSKLQEKLYIGRHK